MNWKKYVSVRRLSGFSMFKFQLNKYPSLLLKVSLKFSGIGFLIRMTNSLNQTDKNIRNYFGHENDEVDERGGDEETAADGDVVPLRAEVVGKQNVSCHPTYPHEQTGEGGQGKEEALLVVPLRLDDEW